LARFVRHETMPDQSCVVAGRPFEKVWVVRNDGDEAWRGEVVLVPSGRGCRDFGMTEPVAVEGGCAQGEEREVRCELKAPELPGLYEAVFRLMDADSEHKFGQSLWLKLMVVEEARAISAEEEDGFVQVDNKI
jgi:hypothetical protein